MSRGERLAVAIMRRLEWKGILDMVDIREIINQAIGAKKPKPPPSPS